MTRAKQDAAEVRRMVSNILSIYLDASELTQAVGRVWYAEERAKCEAFAERHKLTLQQVAGAAAAISPGMRWETVYSYLVAIRKDPKASVPTYSREFVMRAHKILRGRDPAEVLSGRKVTAFYGLLSGTDLGAVVIDGHAWNIARGECHTFRTNEYHTKADMPSALQITPRRYRLAVQAYREAGEVLGEPAHSVQACTWVHWREIFKRGAV